MPSRLPSDLPASPPAVELIPGGPVVGNVRPPGSKSLTNRALICAAFASGPSRLSGALQSEDTEVMIAALRRIGVQIDVRDAGRVIEVDPAAAAPCREAMELFVANSGTTVRFLTAALSAFGGQYRLVGVSKMHERPIGDLIRAIEPLIQGSIQATSPGDCPPVEIDSSGWSGQRVSVAGSVSSQYLSGLMLAAPIALSRANRGSAAEVSLTIDVAGELVSRPYVDMTASVMRSFAAEVDMNDSMAVRIMPRAYQGREYAIEPDASAASYFWAAAAISGGTVRVDGLSKQAMQGDVAFCEVLAQMGCDVSDADDSITVTGGPLRGVDVDMNAISDTVQTLAAVAMFASGSTRVRGVAHNRFKETDRIGDLATELRKLGATIDEQSDGLVITPPPPQQLRGATLETYHDHRMAMSLSLIGLRVAGVRVLNPACTAKTYPQFFADVQRLIGRPHRWT
jgi:3-phosphoshikimate 1-carboxyvinyltransferase